MKSCCIIEVEEDSLVIDLPEEHSHLDAWLGDVESCGGDAAPWLKLLDKVMGQGQSDSFNESETEKEHTSEAVR
ncbi:hypothetical protein OIN60_16580 [Paenibacillus sp. P96]|uniref:Uncharacterized protein n=1 Tax=Paenibacillus zeirhizosphaerae TaxID=2987519 RepID=A0ABT9FUG2_9BACL|nr:hypothetical protein [Paenibacillus sp. P96]MDP4098374.1 hypothetical protein [Paenibacillus sp. P96]